MKCAACNEGLTALPCLCELDLGKAYAFAAPLEIESRPGELKMLRQAVDDLERERCELRKAVLTAREDGRTAEWRFVTQSWLRNLGGKVFPKAHFIDALAVTTTRLREALVRSEQQAEIYRLETHRWKDALAESEKQVASLSVDLIDRNRMCEQLGRLLQRQKCGCVYLDCRKHGAYTPDDCELYARVIAQDTSDETKLKPGQRLEPGEGYRLLVAGEALLETDEFYAVDWHQWRKTLLPGTHAAGTSYRRKL